jgi:thiamine biosynthesis lipoprotein
MRSADRAFVATVFVLLLAGAGARSETPTAIHQQLYSMGTMFDIVVYHASRAEADRAIAAAMEEILRLDAVLSHYKPDSDLSRLNREGGRDWVSVDPSLYDVIERSVVFSRRSNGAFDVTIAPLLQAWKRAARDGRHPSATQIAEARRCVGYDKIELSPPERIRFRVDCAAIDLGGIGKGYAVDRALDILRSAGIAHAMINAGSSSIAAIGAPPGGTGWRVVLGASERGPTSVMLRGNSVSTSLQDRDTPAADGDSSGDIIDPRRGEPAQRGLTVSVIAPSATVADALSTTLLLVGTGGAESVLAHFPDTAALWMTPRGDVHATYRHARLHFSEAR